MGSGEAKRSSSDPPADDEPRGAQRLQPGAIEQPLERAGPVTITRLLKDDGRSLILYAHEEREEK